MRGSRNFWQGGGDRLRRFLVLSLFYRGGGGGGGGAMVLLQRKLYFLKDPEGVQHFQREERSASFF